MGALQAHSEYVGEILVRRGVVSADRMGPLVQSVREKGQPLIELIVTGKVAEERAIAQAFAAEYGLHFLQKVDVDAIPDDVASKIPITYAKQHKILPLAEHNGVVYCVTADPLEVTAIDDVRTIFGKPVELAVTTSEVVLDAINRVWERKERPATSRATRPTRKKRSSTSSTPTTRRPSSLGSTASSPRRSASERAISTSSPKSATSSCASGWTASSTSSAARASSSWRTSWRA